MITQMIPSRSHSTEIARNAVMPPKIARAGERKSSTAISPAASSAGSPVNSSALRPRPAAFRLV